MSASPPPDSGAPAAGGPPMLPTAQQVITITGPIQIGLLLNWGLMGLFIHQVHVYSTNYAKSDKPLFRWLVYGVLALELLFTATMTHLVHYILIEGWGNPFNLTILPWSATFLVPSSSTIGCIVQCFFAWRVWMLNSDSLFIRLVTAIVPLIAFLQFFSGIALSIVWYGDGLNLPESRTHHDHESLILIDLIAAAVGDILVTSLLVLSLWRARTKSKAVRTTTQLFNRLIIRAIETGTVTSVVAVIGMSLYIHPKLKKDAYFATSALSLGKFYSTMLMTNLNGRGYFSGANRDNTSISVSRSVNISDGYDMEVSRGTNSTNRRPGIVVNTTVDHDQSMLDLKDSDTKPFHRM